MEPTYIPQISTEGLSFNSLSLGQGFLQAIFYFSIIFTIIFTIILFMHWKKYAPEPVKIFIYTMVYLIGTLFLVLSQILLLANY